MTDARAKRRARTRAERFRRPATVVMYWSDRGLVFHDYATNRRVSGESVTCQLLEYFGDWTTVKEAATRCGMTRETLAPIVSELVRAGLLQTQTLGDAASRQQRSSEGWRAWNPSAGFFHSVARDVAGPAETSRVTDFSSQQPTIVARKPRSMRREPGSIPLDPADGRGEFCDVLLGRRTWRQFGRDGLSLQDLGTLLQLTWGAQKVVRTAEGIRLVLKTSPSAGALQALQCYVLALNVDGLAPAFYHYASESHRLNTVTLSKTPADLERYIPGQWWYQEAAAVIAMTATFDRVQRQYRQPRAYRSIWLEAGHFCQTFCLVATWLGLAPFCTAWLNDTAIEHDLGIDGVTEGVIYAAGVGTRPEGVAWAPVPKT